MRNLHMDRTLVK
jgi:hypothetical protein